MTAKGPANAPQLTGSVRAQGLQASGGEIKTPVAIPGIDLTLTPDSIMSNTFTATSGSTTLSMVFTLLQYAAANRSVDATVKTDGANVAELLNIAKAYGVEATQGVTGNGKLSLNVHAKGPLASASALSYAGSANIAGLTLNSPQLKKPLMISAANATFSQNSVSLDHMAASLGSSSVQGSLSAKNFAAPEVAFNLTADKVDVDELQNITTAPPSKPAKGGKMQTPSILLATTGAGTLAAGTIKSNDIVLKNVNAKCQLDKGLISLSPLSTEIFGGKATGSLTADMRGTTPQCSEKIKFAGVDANSMLSAVSSMKDMLTGILAFAADTNRALSCAARETTLARTLNGAIVFNLTNGVIKNINLINEINKVGRMLSSGGGEASNGTAVKKFGGTLTIVNGVASTQDLGRRADVNGGDWRRKAGTLNLVNEDVNMHATATIGSASGQPASGSLLNTVLATGKGQLVVPVIVSGNMAHPSVTPDAAEMAKLKQAIWPVALKLGGRSA